MSQSEPCNGKIGGRLIALAILGTLAIILFSSHQLSSTQLVEAQAHGPQRKTRPKANTQTRKPLLDSNFKHETHREPKTKLICSECHTIPLREAPDEIAATTKPSIKGYPYHNSCLECHRETPPQFFSGAAPTICTVCHTRSSPRLTVREVSPFPEQINLTFRQLPGYFPHEKHRQVISDLTKVADLKQVGCTDCHHTDERTPVAFLIGGDEKTLTPAAGTFKISPDLPNRPPSAHSSCFGCHWQTTDEAKKPSKNNCSGCHLTQKDFAQKKSFLLLPIRAPWFKDWPHDWPRRVSLKFRHERKEHVASCTSCHANIVETTTLNIGDVSIVSCLKCHKSEKPKIFAEMEAEDEDSKQVRNNDPASKEGKNTCSGCHTTLIGSAPPPCSHYRLDEDKYLTGDFPKVGERCKE
ncbi:MAG TPA: cytochrome c3 family protein [Pyrinomonadaceae bacterium]|nr:cytochrome c3 family protein [Pyrinomonadaceae bacterium]